MAANTSDFADRPRLVEEARSQIWNYFAYTADSQGNMDTSAPACKRGFKHALTKGADTSNSAHLSDRHAELLTELRERQVSEYDAATTVTSSSSQRSRSLFVSVCLMRQFRAVRTV